MNSLVVGKSRGRDERETVVSVPILMMSLTNHRSRSGEKNAKVLFALAVICPRACTTRVKAFCRRCLPPSLFRTSRGVKTTARDAILTAILTAFS